MSFESDWDYHFTLPYSVKRMNSRTRRINKMRRKKGIKEISDFFNYGKIYFSNFDSYLEWLKSGDYFCLTSKRNYTLSDRENLLKILNGVRLDLSIPPLSFHNMSSYIAKNYDEECDWFFYDRSKLKSYESKINEVDVIRTRKTTEKSGFVYIVSSDTHNGYLKIGSTIDLKSRLRSYNTSSPHCDFYYVYYKFVDDRLYFENLLLKKFSNNIINGEWVDCSENKVIEEIDKLTCTC